MLTPEELEIAKRAKELGKTPDEALAGIAKYRASKGNTAKEEPKETMQNRLADVGNNAASDISNAITGQGKYQGQSPLTRGIGATKSAFLTVPEGAVAMAPEPVRKGIEKVGDVIGGGFKALTSLIGSNKQLQEWTMKHPEATDKILEIAQGTADLGAIAGTIAGAQGTVNTAGTAARLSSTGYTATSNLLKNATTVVKDTASKAAKVVGSPEKSVVGAVGEVLQGKPDDIAKGIKAFKEIDTTGVKTYAELGTKIDESIMSLSRKVDDELAKDLTKTPLDQLDTTLKTKSGVIVKTNYVDTALKQMKELYEKTGDVKAAADIDELIATATKDGLTKQDVNNIARVYNTEFGSKAFGKTGDPLTSVNAQLYETVRKGLKGKAREGIGGAEAKAADEAISSLYNTKALVTKNIEAVNKLQQKIAERGLTEKAGYYLTKYADILTGGTIRGMVGGLLPRGAGYKTLNALDLEERLQKNLEIIKRASEASDEAEINKILSELEN